MTIQKNKSGQIEIKTKKALIIIDEKVKINDVDLEGAGEYEIGEVAVEGIDDDTYILQAEDISIGLVNFRRKISKEIVEKLSNTSVLIAKINGHIDEMVEQVGQIEPNIIVYIGGKDEREKLEKTGAGAELVESLKISKPDITENEKTYFIESADGERAKEN